MGIAPSLAERGRTYTEESLDTVSHAPVTLQPKRGRPKEGSRPLPKVSPASIPVPTLQQVKDDLKAHKMALASAIEERENDPEPYRPWIKPGHYILSDQVKKEATDFLQEFGGLYAPPLRGWKQIAMFMGMDAETLKKRHRRELEHLNVIFQKDGKIKGCRFSRVMWCAWPSELINWTRWKASRKEII